MQCEERDGSLEDVQDLLKGPIRSTVNSRSYATNFLFSKGGSGPRLSAGLVAVVGLSWLI